MNCITKILRKKEIKQCTALDVSIRFSRIQLKGDEYPSYMLDYSRMIGLINDGILSENII